VDSADFDRLDAILGRAQVVLLTGEELVGAERIRALYESVYTPVRPLDGTDHRRIKHHIVNLRVGSPNADGVYPAEAYYFVYVAGDHGPTLKSSGRYRERVRWDGSRWTILRHEILPDL
jgi:hypothetical protein